MFAVVESLWLSNKLTFKEDIKQDINLQISPEMHASRFDEIFPILV